MSQLALPMPSARHDALCASLPITPAEEGPDGSLRSWWLQGAAARYRGEDQWVAWSVTPVPPGCLAYESGARWFYSAGSRGTTQVGSGHSTGPMRGDRDEVARFAQQTLVRVDAAWRAARAREDAWSGASQERGT